MDDYLGETLDQFKAHTNKNYKQNSLGRVMELVIACKWNVNGEAML